MLMVSVLQTNEHLMRSNRSSMAEPLPSDLSESIDAVRNIGNFSAADALGSLL